MIDGRKSVQYLRLNNGKNLYVHIDNRYGRYACGINGTSQHYSFETLSDLKQKVNDLKKDSTT